MDTTFVRKLPKIRHLWQTIISYGNVNLTYKRRTASGKCFMLAYRQDGKRKFDSFSDEESAIQAANTKARQLSTLGVKAAQLSDDDLRACVSAMDAAKPLGLSVKSEAWSRPRRNITLRTPRNTSRNISASVITMVKVSGWPVNGLVWARNGWDCPGKSAPKIFCGCVRINIRALGNS